MKNLFQIVIIDIVVCSFLLLGKPVFADEKNVDLKDISNQKSTANNVSNHSVGADKYVIQGGAFLLLYNQTEDKDAMKAVVRNAIEREALQQSSVRFIDGVLSSSSTDTSLSAGGKALAVYNMYQSADQLRNAKNDKQKAFASADIITAGLTIAAPPVGALVGLAVMGTKLVDGLLDMQHSTYMQRIAEQINKNMEVVIEEQQKRVEAERVHLNSLREIFIEAFQKNQKLLSNLSNTKKVLNQTQEEGLLKKYNELSNSLSFYRIMWGVSHEILDYQSTDPFVVELYERSYDRKLLQIELNKLQENIQSTQNEMNQALDAYLKAKIKSYLDEVFEKNMTPVAAEFLHSCALSYQQKVFQLMNFKIDEHVSRIKNKTAASLVKVFLTVDRIQYLEEISTYTNSRCAIDVTKNLDRENKQIKMEYDFSSSDFLVPITGKG